VTVSECGARTGCGAGSECVTGRESLTRSACVARSKPVTGSAREVLSEPRCWEQVCGWNCGSWRGWSWGSGQREHLKVDGLEGS
jgi:hypothetical protein